MRRSDSKLIRVLLPIILLIASAIACRGKTNVLLGKWEQIDQPSNTIEFFRDGTVVWGDLTLNYDVIDKTHLRLDANGQSMTINFSIVADRLTLYDEETSTEFKRVPE